MADHLGVRMAHFLCLAEGVIHLLIKIITTKPRPCATEKSTNLGHRKGSVMADNPKCIGVGVQCWLGQCVCVCVVLICRKNTSKKGVTYYA